MTILHSSLQGEDIIENTIGKCHVFAFSMQKEVILEHSNVKCHLNGCKTYMASYMTCNG